LRSALQVLGSGLPSIARELERREALAAATPSIWPAHGWLTDRFGTRKDPLTGQPAFHPGLDISTPAGQPVYATGDGIVEVAAFSGDFGNLVELRHEFGLSTRYAHLSRFAVVPGATVKRGDVVGYVGATGRATGSHVHYEILLNGTSIDPLQVLTAVARPQETIGRPLATP
jgi:murein DD-endopeptidase MepM/ murein hydrolase activator NlpD